MFVRFCFVLLFCLAFFFLYDMQMLAPNGGTCVVLERCLLDVDGITVDADTQYELLRWKYWYQMVMVTPKTLETVLMNALGDI